MNNEEWYVILNMNCEYEICRMCPKSGLFKGSYEECEKWIEQKEKEEMTDEEMAEEYFEKECLHSYADTEEELKEDVVPAFLAGLKAGRPQWHDLRKDPNDLPKDKEYVLVYTNLTNYYVAEKVNDHFMSKGWGFIPMSTVIAWCEIPTFDKE